MRSAPRGGSTLAVEVTNVSRHGLWILIEGRELFLDYGHFPWFEVARLTEIVNVCMPHARHLYWPDLDVDVDVDVADRGRSRT